LFQSLRAEQWRALFCTPHLRAMQHVRTRNVGGEAIQHEIAGQLRRPVRAARPSVLHGHQHVSRKRSFLRFIRHEPSTVRALHVVREMREQANFFYGHLRSAALQLNDVT